MTTVTITCAWCSKDKEKEASEASRSRRLGRAMYCSQSCSASASNLNKRSKEIVSTCPCGKRFKTTTKVKAAKHCSGSCASRFSMNKARREAQRQAGLAAKENLISPAETLKRREAWKYAALREVLGYRPHEFEYALGKYVFDLALLDEKILVEFDGPYHEGHDQKITDKKKEEAAARAGFKVVRREVKPATIVDPFTIIGL